MPLSRKPGQFGFALRCFLAALLCFILCGWSTRAFAVPPPAGTSITNRAYATFEVEGQPVRLDSNIVSVTVSPVEDLTLVADNDVRQPPGATAYLPHRLTNTGNTPTSYTFTLTNLGGDDFDLSDLTLYRDVNGNGQPDAGEPVIGAGDSISLEAGASADLVIAGVLPASATPDTIARVQLVASSTSGAATALNTDTIRVESGVSVDVRKAVTPQSAQRGEEVSFTVTATNRGASAPAAIPVTVDGASQNLIIVRDIVPTNTIFVALDDPGFGIRLYHRIGDPLHTYTTSTPTNLQDVDAIAVGAPTFPANGTLILRFRVQVSSIAAGNITNQARMYFQDGSGNQVREVTSNVVLIPIPTASPTLQYFTDDSYTRPTSVTGIGRPLYLQANAAACNQSATEFERVVITVTSRLTGDSVRYTAIETGANSGIFRVAPPIPTSGEAPNAGNDVLEIQTNDTLVARLADCGGGEDAVASILVDPFGVVFDSRTNAPIAGATVTLIDVTGGGNGGNAGGPATVFEFDGVTPAPSTVVTGPDGAFQFPQVAPSTYRLVVTPPAGYTFPSQIPPALLPPGRIIDEPGSFGGDFVITATGGAVQLDVPVDPPTPSGLFIEKTASRRVVEIADFVDYLLRVRNNSGVAIFGATLRDVLPRGFALQQNSVKIDGASTPDPPGAPGPQLNFTLGDLAPEEEITITYRVRVGANARTGENRNRAVATGGIVGGAITSNVGAATVRVEAGVFTTRGIIIGKVFVDVNGNRVQDITEVGIPGVRIYIEDGTFAITDSEGKYSIYGVSARTHNVKLDMTTMPRGSVLAPLSVKHAGSGSSSFADMTNGEMQKINFAEVSATDEILKNVHERRKRAEKADLALAETDALNTDLNPEGPDGPASDTRSLPASGTKTAGGVRVSDTRNTAGVGRFPPQGYGTVPQLNTTREPFNGEVPRTALDGPLDGFAAPPVAVSPNLSLKTLDEVLPSLDNELGFVDFKDKDTLPGSQASVRVKGTLGATFRLLVNGQPVPDSRLGSRAQFAPKQLEAWEWIGVRFKAGPNTLEVQQLDNFGNPRGSKIITLIAPGTLAQLEIGAEKPAYAADGQTPVAVRLQLTDDKGTAISARTPITLETSAGFWRVDDLNHSEPGVQVFLEGGEGVFNLIPPQEPAEALVRATSGAIVSTLRLSFLPELRPLIASGVLDAKLGFGFNARSARRVGIGDSFDDDLRTFAESGNTDLGLRGAMFLKGRIQGKYLLTMRYDSEKDEDERLFRDIQPDEYYPVYGDASTRGFDAQSTGRLYVRVDRNHSYVLYGDFTTLDPNDTQSLARYSRSFTGFKAHHETERFSGTAFFSRDNSRRVFEELRAAGISGPYLLGNPDILENSEKVEIVVRDRNQPSVVLRVTPQSRFADYTIDGLTEGLLFRAPVPAYDADLNPVYIRVSYEVEQGGPKFNVFGFNGQFKVTNNFQLGGSLIQDQNPEDRTSLRSINAIYRLSQSTVILGEWAQSDTDEGKGDATRLEVLHNSRKLQARLLWGRSSAEYDNPESILSQGRSETSLRATYRMNEKTRLSGEIVRTEDRVNGAELTGAQASLERAFSTRLRGQFGVRHGTGQSQAVSGGGDGARVDFTSLFARLNFQVTPKANIFGRYEKSLTNDTQSFALGGDYQIAPRTRAYLVHEFLDSPDGLYALNENDRSYRTRFGVETDYMKNGHAFGEYRMGNGIDGRSAQAAFGVRNLWPIGRGVRISTLFERTRALGETDGFGLASDEDSTAAGMGIEWLRGQNFKATARLEARRGESYDSVLQTLGVAYKPSRDWTLLARNAFSKRSGGPGGDRTQGRFQLGAAYRQTDTDRFHALMKYEYRIGEDGGTFGSGFSSDSDRRVHIFSLDANYQPQQRLSMRLHSAWKRAIERDSGEAISAILLSARVVREISPRTDLSFIISTLQGSNPDSSKYGVGVELSYALTRNLLMSAGYNFFDLRDDDLLAGGEGRRGAYLRMRLKFDEDAFAGMLGADKPAILDAKPGFIPVATSGAVPVVVPGTGPLGGTVGVAGGSQ